MPKNYRRKILSGKGNPIKNNARANATQSRIPTNTLIIKKEGASAFETPSGIVKINNSNILKAPSNL